MVGTVCSTQWAERGHETKLRKIILANVKWELWASNAVDQSLK